MLKKITLKAIHENILRKGVFNAGNILMPINILFYFIFNKFVIIYDEHDYDEYNL